MSRAEIIFELLDEIRAMEDTVLYFQNRILRKRISIAEIMQGLEVRQDDHVTPIPVAINGGAHVNVNWENFLQEKNGDIFSRKDMECYASSMGVPEKRVERRARHAINYWLSLGRVRCCGEGIYCKNNGITV